VGIGSVIRNYSGRAVAATSIGLPVHRVNDSVLELFINVVRMAASLISYRLGYISSGQIHHIRELRNWWQKNKPSTDS
jgi:hypothetical protein